MMRVVLLCTLSEATTQKTLDSLSSYYYYDGRAEEGRVDYYGYGGELTLVLHSDDLDAIKASDIAVDASSTYLTAQAGGVGDMTGNTLDPTLLRKPSASYLPDVTPPTLSSFDLDLDEGLLHIEFGESGRRGHARPVQNPTDAGRLRLGGGYQ